VSPGLKTPPVSTWWMKWGEWKFSATFTKRLWTPLLWLNFHPRTSTTFLRAIQVYEIYVFSFHPYIKFPFALTTLGQLAWGLSHFHQKGYFLTLAESQVDEQSRKGCSSALVKAAATAVRVVGDLCLWYGVDWKY